jgi:hypothetical protein
MANDDGTIEPPLSDLGRGQHFGAGMLSGGEPSSGLQQLAARYKAQTPTKYMPSGTSNGMSADQFSATLGGQFDNQNGSSTDTWATKKYFGGF